MSCITLQEKTQEHMYNICHVEMTIELPYATKLI